MVFSNYKIKFLVRVLILALSIFLMVYAALILKNFIRTLFTLAFCIASITELLNFVNKANKDFKSFLNALIYEDFTNYYSKSKSKESEVYALFNKLNEKWSAVESFVLDPPNRDLSKPEIILRRILRIMFAVIRDLVNGQISLHAMSLVYTTILSVVPLLALSFSVLKAFNVQDKFTPMLYIFLEPMGEKGREIN